MDNIVEKIVSSQKGDKQALKELIEHYTPFLRKLANNVYTTYPGLADYDDILQEGYIGLMNGLSKYDPEKDPSKGKNVLTFLLGWTKEGLYGAIKYRPSMLTTSIYDSQVDKDNIAYYLEDPINLEELVIENNKNPNYESELRLEELERLIEDFSIQEKLAFKLRFGFYSEPRTLVETGKVLNISYQTVKNMESRILERLRLTKVDIRHV